MTQPKIGGLADMWLTAATDETLALLGRALAQAIDTTENAEQLAGLGSYYAAVVQERSARLAARAAAPPQLSDPALPAPPMPPVWIGHHPMTTPIFHCSHINSGYLPCPENCHRPLGWPHREDPE